MSRRARFAVFSALLALVVALPAGAQARRRPRASWTSRWTMSAELGVGSTTQYPINLPRLSVRGYVGRRLTRGFSLGASVVASGFLLPECRLGCAPLAHAGFGAYAAAHLPGGRRLRGVASWEPVLTGSVGYAAVSGWGTVVPPSGVATLSASAALMIRAESELMIGPFFAADGLFVVAGPRVVPIYGTLQAGLKFTLFVSP
ncbi:MAG: hypothetical protein JNK05_08885 [Myxococcales bacterium]|nr:hypothetical protein [Myxococcales bacterium]